MYFLLRYFYKKARGGGHLAPEFIAMAIFSFSFGKLSRYLSVRNLMIFGFILIALASLLLTRVNAETPYIPIAITLFILGAGMGMSTPAIGALVMASVDKAYSGIASAVMNALRQTGMTLGIALLGTLMTHRAVEQLLQDDKLVGMLSTQEIKHLIQTSSAMPSAFIEQVTRSAFVSGFNVAMLGGAVAIMITLCLMARYKSVN